MSYTIKDCDLESVLQLRHEVMWPEETVDFVRVEGDDAAKHLGLYVNDELVSVVSLFLKDERAQFRKFATKQSKQNKGYGTKLLNASFEYLKNKGIEEVYCNARIDKTSFYKRFGMEEKGKTFISNKREYIIMAKNL